MRSSEHSAPKDSQMMMAAIYRGPICQVLRIKNRMSPADIFRKISRLWHDVDQSKHKITYFSPYDKNMRVRLVDDVDVECMLDVYRMMKIPLMPLKLETIESQSTDKGGMTFPTENPNDDNSQRGSDDCPGSSTKKFPSRSARRRKAKRIWLREWKRLGNLHLLFGNQQEAQRQRPEEDSHEDLHDRDEVDLDNEDTAEEIEMEGANLLQKDQSPEKESHGHLHGRVEMDQHNEDTGQGIDMEGALLSQKAQILGRSARRKKAKRKWLRELKMRVQQEAQRQSPEDRHEDLHDRGEGDLDNEGTAEEMEMEDANLLQKDQTPEKDSHADLHDRVETDRHNEVTGEGMDMEGVQLSQKAQIPSRSARRKKAKRKWIREHKISTARKHAQSRPENDSREEGHVHGEVNLDKENAGE